MIKRVLEEDEEVEFEPLRVQSFLEDPGSKIKELFLGTASKTFRQEEAPESQHQKIYEKNI